MAEISIVCGLGNPGPRYHSTRHNLGFMALDKVSKRHALSWRRAAGPSQCSRWKVGGREVTLIKPLLYMNESGVAIARYGIASKGTFLVVCDDLNLPLGSFRFRPRGGSGGHKGLDSIIEHLGTEEFPRLRLGIGGASPDTDWVEFVLSDFLPRERETVKEMVEAAAGAIETAVLDGLDAAMRRFNRTDGLSGCA